MVYINKLCVILMFLLFLGCNKDIDFSGETSNYILVLVSGNNQVGLQNTLLFDDITVRVEDETGGVISGIKLNAQVVSGGGKTLSEQIITNEDGLASISWELGDLYTNELKVFLSRDQASSVLVGAQAKYNYKLPEVINDGLSDRKSVV